MQHHRRQACHGFVVVTAGTAPPFLTVELGQTPLEELLAPMPERPD